MSGEKCADRNRQAVRHRGQGSHRLYEMSAVAAGVCRRVVASTNESGADPVRTDATQSAASRCSTAFLWRRPKKDRFAPGAKPRSLLPYRAAKPRMVTFPR